MSRFTPTCPEKSMAPIKVCGRESYRIRKQHGSDCPLLAYVVFNKMTWYYITYAIICTTIYLTLGWNSLKFHFIFAAFGLWFQCFANYITHYGLQRNKDKNGIYESINKYHSWNFVSSPIYFRLPRHSDHHTSSFRPY
jgi:alkane 1-monooxygenase